MDFERASPMPAPARALFAWHASAGAFERLAPPWQAIRVVQRRWGRGNRFIGEGAVLRMALRVGPLALPWVAEHTHYDPPTSFRDLQRTGPFARWEHTHWCLPGEAEGNSLLRDSVFYDPPGGGLGRLLGGAKIARDLDRLFWFRHERTAADLARHAAGPAPMTVAIAGSSGLIGTALAAFLSTGGHRVVRLVRRPADPDPVDGFEQRRWQPEAMELDPASLADVDAVVNLCGRDVSRGRWTDRSLARMEASRTAPTALLARTIAGLPASRRPRVLVNASGLHAYGDRGDEVLTERSRPGSGALASMVARWEAATRPADLAGVRVVCLRLGMVLAARGGVLPRLLGPTRLGLGGPVGQGRQWWPWIGLDDVLGVCLHALGDEGLAGPVNACAPNPAAAADVTQAIAEAAGTPAVLGLPAPIARAALGRARADELLLASIQAEPAALTDRGFTFHTPTPRRAVGWELGVRRMCAGHAGHTAPRAPATGAPHTA